MDPETSSRRQAAAGPAGKARGAPGAVRAARRVRKGARGRRPVVTPAPRPRAYLTGVVTPLEPLASSNPVDSGWMAVRTRPS